ncbi:PREDICTED: uncharacterized protein LOC105504833 [Colobus angolensis palliatus]|uniref:uncharacterized protein LOC105504833 n=1 Tax=Colobus angolensis palliatus TaxID=336983 RepID=UPI0005F38EC1|nr:PREDICTED: uncharacterized protein LOC105504833 [Colobus angolensis palliatus]
MVQEVEPGDVRLSGSSRQDRAAKSSASTQPVQSGPVTQGTLNQDRRHYRCKGGCQRGGGAVGSLCQPEAEINASSWPLGSREPGRGRFHSSPTQSPASSQIPWEPPTSVSQAQKTPSHEELGQTLLAPCKEEHSSALTQLRLQPSSLPQSPYSGSETPGLQHASSELWKRKNYSWKEDRRWPFLCSRLTMVLQPRRCQVRSVPGLRPGVGGGQWLPVVLEPLAYSPESLKLSRERHG